MYNIPNTVTITRLAAVPILVLFFYFPFEWTNWIAAIIFSAAALTDWLDGFLARRLNQATAFGAFLDPVVDKILVVVALLILMTRADQSMWYLVPALVIISREITISALREWMAEIGKRTSVAVNFIGKAKTFIQMTALAILLTDHAELMMFGFILLYLAVVLTIWSMIIYLKVAWPDLTKSSKSP